MKNIILAFLAGILVTVGGFIVYERIQEDTWLCQNDQWVKHGNPTAPMPMGKCGTGGASSASSASLMPPQTGSGQQQSASSLPTSGSSLATSGSVLPTSSSSITSLVSSLPLKGEESSLQPVTKTFSAADFEITYPDWSPLPPESILEPTNTKVGVRNAGCGFIVTVRQLPAGDQFKPFIEKLIADQVKASNVTIIKKEISDTMMHVEGEFPVGTRAATTSQYGYMTKGGQLYSVVFASEKSVFQAACAPFVEATIGSVKVK